MTTIQEIASALGVSRQSVYSLIKEAGLSLDSLTVEKRGNTRYFDDSVIETVKRLTVKPTTVECKVSESVNDSLTLEIERLRADLAKITSERDLLREKADRLAGDLEEAKNRADQDQQRIDRLEARVDHLLQLTAEQADTIHLRELRDQAKLLEPPTADVVEPIQEATVDQANAQSADKDLEKGDQDKPVEQPATPIETPQPPARRGLLGWISTLGARITGK